MVDPLNPSKTWSRGIEAIQGAAAEEAKKKSLATGQVGKALEEPDHPHPQRAGDRGHCIPGLDHDYLTRGIWAAERRANQWRFVLEEGARAFNNAGTLQRKWRALLPPWTQLRLFFRYGSSQNYAFISLCRFPAIVMSVSFVLLVSLASLLGYSFWTFAAHPSEDAASDIKRSSWKLIPL